MMVIYLLLDQIIRSQDEVWLVQLLQPDIIKENNKRRKQQFEIRNVSRVDRNRFVPLRWKQAKHSPSARMPQNSIEPFTFTEHRMSIESATRNRDDPFT